METAGIGVRAREPSRPAAWGRSLLRALPQGRGLPAADWEHRHRGLLAVLWLHVVGVPVFGIAQGHSIGHSLLEGCALLAAALAAKFAPVGQRLRSGALCVGLLTASGLLVHFSGGYIEFHFHFFVMIGLLTLYVDWFPFLLAVAYVLAHHGVVGVLDPAAVYNHPDAIAQPWKWAGIHAGFVMAAGAASIFTWRISEDEARRRANIERVTEAALAKLPLAQLLDELLARIGEVLHADVATIWLFQDGELVLRSVHGAGAGSPADRIRLPVDQGLHGRIVSERRPEVVTDVDPDTLHNPIHRACGVRAVAGVPLLVEGSLVGVLDVAFTRPTQFSGAEVDLLQLVADRIGPAIDRARLYEQEHQIAATLQRSLLPKRLPKLPGVEVVARYLPAGEHVSVGGDWYDAIELPGRLALVMGDVAGHGSEAAALMGQLRTGVRAYAAEGHPPAEVVGRLNTLLHGLDDDSMATLLYLELDLGTWRGQLVTAGHPPPVLLEADGRCRFLEGSRGAPLGVFPYTVYPSDEIEVPPGATLVFYTDGLIERRNAGFGTAMEGLLRRIAPDGGKHADAICAGVIDAAVADGPLADDAAVLALQRSIEPSPTFAVELAAVPSAIRAIRRRLEHFARSAGASPDETYDIVTSACEACANAIQHAYGGRDAVFSVTGALADGAVELTIADSGRWRPEVSDNGGRGLMLMRALMDDVRIVRSESGTRVTLSRRLDRAGQGAAGRP